MKFKILLSLVCFQIGFAQNTFPYPENGNIGIGTTLPQAKLHINNGDNSYGAILANASESQFSLYTKTLTTGINSETFRIGLKYGPNENNSFISFYRGLSSSGGYLGFSTSGTEQLRILANGNIGIGTNLPAASLEIKTPAITGSETLLKLGVSDAAQDYIRIANGTNADNQ
ncbi:hypothetical protein, partial [Flavobacterium sp. Root901]|uniref:hypothetical protein n=1 Tax=Flavobacterium sp. Root901 TaxID=1736605 RepID=UPI000B3318DC